MSRKRGRSVRDAPVRQNPARQQRTNLAVVNSDSWKILCADGYRPITQCPEVQMCINTYADLISIMTIRLMRNTENGDIRVHNELSRIMDIRPAVHMSHVQFMQTIVRAMMETGNAVVVPVYDGEYLDYLQPLPPSQVGFTEDAGAGYLINYQGRVFRPDEVIHFVLNPDPDKPWKGRGYAPYLREIVRSIRQANSTRQALQESPAPSLIVKVDGLVEEFRSVEGRRELGKQFLDASEMGQPWFIPAEAFGVEQVKPMTLNDLAIKDNLELDKRSVAAIFGVPPFLVGVGEYKQDAYQQFISTKLMAVAKEIEQKLTQSLLYSPELYWSLNPRSLYNYSMTDLITAGKEMVDRMAMRRNEWRDWLGVPPDPDMQDLLGLENYLPVDRLGDQKKLKGGEEVGATDQGD